jgi:DNA polymerase elongation subunit (family B)
LKILALDIETAPNTAYVWGLFKENIPLERLIETGRVMCFAYKWIGAEKVHFMSEHKHGHEETIRAAKKVLDSADAVLTFNGERFDLPILNREFLQYKIEPPAPYRSIDLLRVARRRFRFTSNKMDHLATELGIKGKFKHSGFELWVDCMAGKRAAWKEMETYNKQDVEVLIELYHRLLPWIDTHPNHGLYIDGDEPVCTNCGSEDVQSRGVQHNKTLSYKRFQCGDCGTWMRARFPEKQSSRRVLTQIGA